MTEPNTVSGTSRPAIKATDLGVRLPKGRGVERLWSEGHWAFRDVNFSLRRGETVALVGRNGSGKSTMLRTLAGILDPDEGSLEVAPGLTTTILAPGAGFDPMLTGRENLYTAALYQGFLPKQIETRIDDIIAFSEIGEWIDQPLAIYSAGMRARLGFSLSLYLPSDILMIDETLSAGDGHFRDKAREAVLELIRSDRTVVLISHSMQMMESMCERGIVLDRGNLLMEGPIDKVLEAYQQLLTGRFDTPGEALGARPSEASTKAPKTRETRQETVVAKAAAILKEIQARREETKAIQAQMRNNFWRTLDALQTEIESALSTSDDQQLGRARVVATYKDMLEARRLFEAAQARDREIIAEVQKARDSLQQARKK